MTAKMYVEQETAVVVRCPIRIDRSTERRRRGWSGDPASRWESCGWTFTYLRRGDGKRQWQEFPNGPTHDAAEDLRGALVAHIATHEPEDFAFKAEEHVLRVSGYIDV